MIIGITGHQKLKDPELWDWVICEIDKLFELYINPVIGISSLAIGADQIFAEAVLKHKGILHVIVPFEGYESKFSKGNNHERYFRLLNEASIVETLERQESDEASYFNAGKRVSDLSDILVAVWNGKPAVGLGGTGDVVEYAVKSNKSIVYINPINQTVLKK